MGKNIHKPYTWKENLYPEFIKKLLQLNNKKTTNSIIGLNNHLQKGDIQMTNKYTKLCWPSLITGEMII